MRKKRKVQKKCDKINSSKVVTQQYLKECVDYNPETGIFTWKQRPKYHFDPDRDNWAWKTWNARFANKEAGSLSEHGYLRISFFGSKRYCHRLAWLFVYGYIPENGIDHKDRVRTHNWIENLREATQQCNMRNAGIRVDNSSGVTGVSFNKKSDLWMSYIEIKKATRIYLGYFKKKDEAVLKRWEAEVKYKFPNCCTSSSSYNYLKNKGLI